MKHSWVYADLYAVTVWMAPCPSCGTPCVTNAHDGAALSCPCGELGRVFRPDEPGDEYRAKWLLPDKEPNP